MLDVFLLTAALWAGASPLPIETTLTYQGELREGGVPADGTYDLDLYLYDSESGGSALSSDLLEDVEVSNGLFTVLVDFGDEYVGFGEWIELRVRRGDELGGFTILLPRQRVTASPYAIQANRVAANAVSGLSVINGTLTGADLASGAVESIDIADNTVTQADIANSAVGTAEIENNSITAADIADYSKTMGFTAGAFVTPDGSAVVVEDRGGISFANSFSGSAVLALPRPQDWNGSSDVVMQLFARTRDTGSGTAQFFIRPRSYDDNDLFFDASSIVTNVVNFASSAGSFGRHREFTVTIPSNRLQDDWWYITLQRDDTPASGTPYTDDVIIVAASLTYTATR